ncbi:MAG TPA: GNAT family N-acetyltransferase [Rhodanobacteraceae bacterium]|nr:GNAT family N-acetyltransferase [Rhodanobacteraceae bacterium]
MTPDPARIREASTADLDALVALERATFASDRISRVQWRRHIGSGTACVLVAGPPGRVEGAAVVFLRRNSRRARLYSLAVAASSRGRGLARSLLAAAEDEARRRGCNALDLEVRTDNRAALALYERHGYRRVVRLQGFYEDAADGWRFSKALADRSQRRTQAS